MECLVVIICPSTRHEVPTGIVTNILTFAEIPKGTSRFQCPACGKTHAWAAADAMLAHTNDGLLQDGKADDK